MPRTKPERCDPVRCRSARAASATSLGEVFAKYKGDVCCWCLEAPPDSREHRFKRTDLVQQFGRGPYLGRDETVIGTNDGHLKPVQGPRSPELKFRPNLCRGCNGTRSQPFDLAWVTFTTYVTNNEDKTVSAKAIDFRDVFGADWKVKAENTARYVVKHAMCRLAQWQVVSPEPIRDFLDGGPHPDCLSLDAEIRTDILAFTRQLREGGIPEGSLWNGPPCEVPGQSGESVGIQAFLGYRWLRIYWAFGEDLGGYPQPFAGPVMHLTEGYGVPPQEQALNPSSARQTVQQPPMTDLEISRADAERFCKALDSIDDIVDQINAEGAAVNVPADMGGILARLADGFRAAAGDAPTPSLRDSVVLAADMFTDASRTHLADPPLAGIAGAQAIYAETMGEIERNAGPEVMAFRKAYCDGNG